MLPQDAPGTRSRSTGPPLPDPPAPGQVCDNCHDLHDQGLCDGHRAGDPPTQCKRTRQRDERWCWAHLKQRSSRTSGRTIADLEAAEATIGKMAANVAGVLPTPPAAHLDPTATAPGGPTATPPTFWDPTGGGQPLHNSDAQPVDNPVLELARMAGILRNAFEAAGQRVNDLSSVSVETRAGGEQLRGEIVLWEKLLGHLRMTLVDMAKLNLDERLVRLEEVRADRVAEALFWLVTALTQRLALDVAAQEVLNELMRSTVHRIVTMGTALESVPSAPVTP